MVTLGVEFRQSLRRRVAPRLAALTPLLDTVESRLAAAEAELVPLISAVHARDDEADRLLGRISDEIWNEVGRPASDPALSILFPNGIAYYADGSEQGQPDRMDLLAELLEANLHPRLAREKAKACATAAIESRNWHLQVRQWPDLCGFPGRASC